MLKVLLRKVRRKKLKILMINWKSIIAKSTRFIEKEPVRFWVRLLRKKGGSLRPNYQIVQKKKYKISISKKSQNDEIIEKSVNYIKKNLFPKTHRTRDKSFLEEKDSVDFYNSNKKENKSLSAAQNFMGYSQQKEEHFLTYTNINDEEIDFCKNEYTSRNLPSTNSKKIFSLIIFF